MTGNNTNLIDGGKGKILIHRDIYELITMAKISNKSSINP